jgi:hypothetical protein
VTATFSVATIGRVPVDGSNYGPWITIVTGASGSGPVWSGSPPPQIRGTRTGRCHGGRAGLHSDGSRSDRNHSRLDRQRSELGSGAVSPG